MVRFDVETGEQVSPSTVKVFVPGPLREYCDGARELPSSASSVRDALQALANNYPALYRNVCDETGAVRRHINIFVNSAHMRDREGLDTVLVPGDELIILPAVSGG
jgi:molybdopterin converting factor small subunit